MGRIKNSSQVVGSTTYPFSYTYDISGALATETYPSGRVVTNAFDAAGRISGVTGSIAPSAYASNVTYAPQGPVSGLTLGSGMTEAWTFNSREQPITLKVTTTGLPLNLGWGYGAAANNNGNVQSQTISGPGLGGITLTQNYTYDAVNRLWTFAETGSTGSQTYNTNQNYNYDAFGNRWLTSSWIAPGMSSQTPTSDAFTNNQWGLNGVNGYDGAGNQTSIAGAYRTFFYDGENRQIMAVIGNPSTTTTYNYDGEGRRVQKITSSGTTTSVYDAMGHLAAEYGGSSTSAGRVYLSVDALGSTRLVTDASGNPTEQYDYAHFGEELTQGIDGRVAPYSTNQYPTTPDAVTEKFTSKERDAETGLDYFGARYFCAAQGRFTSPDEVFADQHARDPQSWNLYAYVRNNPLAMVDVKGNDAVEVKNKDTGQTTIIIPVHITDWRHAREYLQDRKQGQLTEPWRLFCQDTGRCNRQEGRWQAEHDGFQPRQKQKIGPAGEGAVLGGKKAHIDTSSATGTDAAATTSCISPASKTSITKDHQIPMAAGRARPRRAMTTQTS